EVTTLSPASRAGIKNNFRILAINGAPVHDVDDLFLQIGLAMAGSTAELEVRSDQGEQQRIRATLGKFYVGGKIIASKKRPLVRGVRVDYVTALMSRDAGPGSRWFPEGVWVRDVEPGTAGDTARLLDTIISEVNGQRVQTPDDFYRIVDKLNDP